MTVIKNYTNAMQSMPFKAMIGGPLSAAVEAQALSAKTSLDFILAVCLEKTSDNKSKVRHVEFNYSKVKSEGGHEESTIQVPLLALVPIPFIRIDDISLTFTASMTSEETASTASEDSKELDVDATLSASGGMPGIFSVEASLSTKFSTSHKNTAHTQNKYNNEMTMDVRVHAINEDMPAGIRKVLGILEENIREIPRDKA